MDALFEKGIAIASPERDDPSRKEKFFGKTFEAFSLRLILLMIKSKPRPEEHLGKRMPTFDKRLSFFNFTADPLIHHLLNTPHNFHTTLAYSIVEN